MKNDFKMYMSFQDFMQNYLNLKKMKVLESENLFFLWKINFIPSSFGKEKSVLDMMENFSENKNIFKGENIEKFIKNQLEKFAKQEEFGLLNRLDNDTSGFLYFAKNKEIYEDFKTKQKNEQIEKIYYAKIEARNLENKKMIIDFPIMHKNKTKMIVIKSKNDEKKGRGKKHFVKTQIELLEKQGEYTWLKITIKKGIRHQIRAHLASIGCPIVGDKLYGGKENNRLCLFSVGIT